MGITDLQLGGGYKYQWECAILLALNYFFDEPLVYNPTLHDLVTSFMGYISEMQLEGLEKDKFLNWEGEDLKKDRELEDINIITGEKRILIQVKTKEAEGVLWTLNDKLLLKALFKFYKRLTTEENPGHTRFVFLTNRDLNPDFQNLIEALHKGTLIPSGQGGNPTEIGKLHQYLSNFITEKNKTGTIDFDRFCEMLSQTSFVYYMQVEVVEANIEAKLQAFGKHDWNQAYAVLFTEFAKKSTLKGGGVVTHDSILELLSQPVASTWETLNCAVSVDVDIPRTGDEKVSALIFQVGPGIQDILQSHQLSGFVGRQEYIKWFETNLVLDSDNKDKRYIIKVLGQGGVGKSALLMQFLLAASKSNYVCGFLDEDAESAVQVMAVVANQLRGQGAPLEELETIISEYTRIFDLIQKDPQTTWNVVSSLLQVRNYGPSLSAETDRLEGLPGGLTGRARATEQGWELVVYLTRKLGSGNKVGLMLDPVAFLSRAFAAGVGQLSQKSSIVLFFDTFEITGKYLSEWLNDLLGGKFGAVADKIIVILAGLHEGEFWEQFSGDLKTIPLEVFTEEEANIFLHQRGVENPAIANEILHLSGRLPLYLAILTSRPIDEIGEVEESADSIARFFLKSIKNAALREAIINLALPRYLDRDIIGQAVTTLPSSDILDFLDNSGYITRHRDKWVFHSQIRFLLVKHLREDSHMIWSTVHGKLADYYENMAKELGLAENDEWANAAWQVFACEGLYHRICQSPTVALPQAINRFLSAIKIKRAFGMPWAEAIEAAGRDSGDVDVERWGRRFIEGLNAIEHENYAGAVGLFSELLASSVLKKDVRSIAIDWRGYLRFLAEDYEGALLDLNEAIRLDPANMDHWVDRGALYTSMGRYEEALEDINHSLELQPNSHRSLTTRGVIHQTLGRLDEAIADFRKAIDWEPLYPWAYAELGEALRQTGQLDEALSSFSRAIELFPNYSWAFNGRAKVHLAKGNLRLVLEDMDCVIKLSPQYDWAYEERGKMRFLAGDFIGAIQDFSVALQAIPGDARLLTWRGDAAYQAGQFNQSISDLTLALGNEPNNYRALVTRALALREVGRVEEAIADFTAALDQEPTSAIAVAERGQCYVLKGDINQALADLSEALRAGIGQAWVFALRAAVFQNIPNYPAAIADLHSALELDPSPYHSDRLGELLMVTGEYERAKEQFARRIEKWPESPFIAHIDVGIIDLCQGSVTCALESFGSGLGQWESTWANPQEVPQTLLVSKAIALICLDRQDEAVEALALAKQMPAKPSKEIERRLLFTATDHREEPIQKILSTISTIV